MRTFHPSRRPGGPRRAAGLTLIEMLVAVSVLAVMIMAFSTILVQSQRFISAAQRSRRSHQVASSLARIIRRDVRRASQQGFLCITSASGGDSNAGPSPVLILTAAGAAQTIAAEPPASGTGAFICYGQVANQVEGSIGDVLWRPAYVLVDEPAAAPDRIERDKWNTSLMRLQVKTRNEVHALVDQVAGQVRNDADRELHVPPTDVEGVENMWQVLAKDIGFLSIMWTDGTVDGYGNLRWYGMDRRPQQLGGATIHRAGDADSRYSNPQSEDLVEESRYNGGNDYRALFTHENQDVWPKAIKIRFLIRDPEMPDQFTEEDGLFYEVVCNIGQ